MEYKADVILGVYYQLPSQAGSTDLLFYRQLGEVSGLVSLVPMTDCNFPDFKWEYLIAMTGMSGKLLNLSESNFLSQYSLSQTE